MAVRRCKNKASAQASRGRTKSKAFDICFLPKSAAFRLAVRRCKNKAFGGYGLRPVQKHAGLQYLTREIALIL